MEAVLLALMLTLTTYGSRKLGFPREDRITITFAGSKKSLAAGLPMASVLFGAQASLAVLPLMLFHQMQLMVCAVLARRRAEDPLPELAADRVARGLPLVPTGGSPGPVTCGGDLDTPARRPRRTPLHPGGLPRLLLRRPRGTPAPTTPAARPAARGRGRLRGRG